MITREGLARTAAVLIALYYLSFTPGLVVALTQGLQVFFLSGEVGILAFILLWGTYVLGTVVLGFWYALHPFRHGFAILAVVGLLPVIVFLIVGESWPA